MTDNLVNLDFNENSNLKQGKKASDKNYSDLELGRNLEILNDQNCIISLSSKSSKSEESGIQEEEEEIYEEEEISLIPEVNFSGISALDSGIERESQPLLGRENSEITYNQFPGKFFHVHFNRVSIFSSLKFCFYQRNTELIRNGTIFAIDSFDFQFFSSKNTMKFNQVQFSCGLSQKFIEKTMRIQRNLENLEQVTKIKRRNNQ